MKDFRILCLGLLPLLLQFSCRENETKPDMATENVKNELVDSNTKEDRIEQVETNLGDKDTLPSESSKPMGSQSGKFLLFSDINGIDEETHIKLKNLNVNRFLRLGTRLIDRDADGTFDEKSVRTKVENYFPETSSEGYCVINWEREAFEKLKGRHSTADFEHATSQYIKLIHFIRNLRPNLKISVYNIPFRTNTISKKSKKFDDSTTQRILSEVDFVCPSLYMLYSLNDVSLEQNKNYIKDNLTRALRIANGRPVIPYIGYRVYSNESEDSKEYLSEKEFKIYTEYMKQLVYNGDKIDGFVVWNGDFLAHKDGTKAFEKRSLSAGDFKKEFNKKIIDYFTIIASVK